MADTVKRKVVAARIRPVVGHKNDKAVFGRRYERGQIADLTPEQAAYYDGLGATVAQVDPDPEPEPRDVTSAGLSGSTADQGLLVDPAEGSVGGAGDLQGTLQADQGVAAPEPLQEPVVTEKNGDGGEDDEESKDGYETLSYADLQKTARGRGLAANGSTQDLIERLRADDQS